jgi:hypothetical protein
MALKVVISEAEKCLRSIGDAPNGIVSVGVDGEHAYFYIDPGLEPSAHPHGGPIDRSGGDEPPGPEVEVEELMAACDSQDAGVALYMTAAGTFKIYVEMAIAQDTLPMIGVALPWLVTVRRALTDHFPPEADG